MRLMTSMVLGLLVACGDKEADDTAVEAEEEVTEEAQEESKPEDTAESEDSGAEQEETEE